jgi:ferredoxin
MKIVLDRVTCMGMGMCESFVPEVFEVDDGGELILHSETVPDGLQELVEQAVEACPTQSLRLQA